MTQQHVPPQARIAPEKFKGLAWSALILGIVGVVGSPIIFLNNVTAVAAAVGVVLGVIALFGTRKTLAGIGTVLCIGGIVFTVLAQQAAVKELDEQLRYQQECANASVLSEQGLSDWCAEKVGDALDELSDK